MPDTPDDDRDPDEAEQRGVDPVRRDKFEQPTNGFRFVDDDETVFEPPSPEHDDRA